MKSNKTNIISIDIGNSRIKLLNEADYYAYELSQDDWTGKIEKIIARYSNEHSHYVVSSVNEPKRLELVELFKRCDKHFTDVSELLGKTNLIDISNVVGMGNDRKLGLLGALTLAEPPVIVIDCGTAVTVNFLDEKRRALGGAIFPGLATQAKSLFDNTVLLPQVELVISGDYCGSTTQTAIQAGIFASVVGGIKEIISKAAKTHFQNIKPTIFLTGGGSPFVAHLLDTFEFTIEPKLVLFGIKYIANEFFLD